MNDGYTCDGTQDAAVICSGELKSLCWPLHRHMTNMHNFATVLSSSLEVQEICSLSIGIKLSYVNIIKTHMCMGNNDVIQLSLPTNKGFIVQWNPS